MILKLIVFKYFHIKIEKRIRNKISKNNEILVHLAYYFIKIYLFIAEFQVNSQFIHHFSFAFFTSGFFNSERFEEYYNFLYILVIEILQICQNDNLLSEVNIYMRIYYYERKIGQ